MKRTILPRALMVTLALASHLIACPSAPVEPPSDDTPATEGAETATFVHIAPGMFSMGSPASEEGRFDNEPQHEVTLTRGFYLQTTEVTQGEWQRVMGNNPSFHSSCGSTCPVEQVSWLDAVSYANARSRLEGLSECYDDAGSVRGGGSIYACTGYRLPTEAEWEYAARAGTTGARHGELGQVAWFFENSRPSGPGMDAVHPVGQLQANAWGLYDMLGNVSEWTHDQYESGSNYPSSPTDPVGDSGSSLQVFRGGNFVSDARVARAAYRTGASPDHRAQNLGFRLARSH